MQKEIIPEDNKAYATQQYWEERYQKDSSTFDWFKEWPDLKQTLSPYVAQEHNILMAGCGNSLLSEQMYQDGFKNIVNIDFSPSVIKSMSERCKDMDSMTWLEMDVTKMDFPSNTFDIVIDKGTMDALLCEQTSAWQVDDDLAANIDKMLSEVTRVLKPTGRYIYITFGQPHFRKNLLLKDKYGWSLQLHTIGEAFHYFIYILTKNQ